MQDLILIGQFKWRAICFRLLAQLLLSLDVLLLTYWLVYINYKNCRVYIWIFNKQLIKKLFFRRNCGVYHLFSRVQQFSLTQSILSETLTKATTKLWWLLEVNPLQMNAYKAYKRKYVVAKSVFIAIISYNN